MLRDAGPAVVAALVVLALVWSAYVAEVNAPCRGLSPLECQESARVRPGPLVAPGGPPGLTAEEVARLSEWGRLSAELKPWEPEHVAAGKRRVPEPLP